MTCGRQHPRHKFAVEYVGIGLKQSLPNHKSTSRGKNSRIRGICELVEDCLRCNHSGSIPETSERPSILLVPETCPDISRI